jgi:hypothetical protein
VGSTVGQFSMDQSWVAGQWGEAAHTGRWRCSARREEGGGIAPGELGHVGRTGRVAGWAESKKRIPFGNKIGFLNLQRLWKFVQGDSGGILWWGFFLNSPRIPKDFRKI